MLNVTITTEQEVDVTLTPTTAAGQPATLDGAPQWSIVFGDGVIKPSSDGLTCVLTSETPGDTQILVEADADLGEGVETISAIVTLTVVGAKASNLGLTAGTPRLKFASHGS